MSSKKIELSAVLISLCALIATILQSCQTIQSNKVAVRPNLSITFNAVRGSEEPHGFKLSNSGVGPGIIKSIEFYVDGIKVPDSGFNTWSNMLKEVGWPEDTSFNEFHLVNLSNGYYVKVDEPEYLLKVLPAKGENKRELTNDEWIKLNKIGIKVSYSSMQDENCSIHYTPANSKPNVIEKCK